MQIIEGLIQGSDEWVAVRTQHYCASEAAAMLGLDDKTTRNELIRLKATGAEKEFSDYVRKHILDKGHEVEALARPLAEAFIGEELFPVTARRELDGLPLLASYDGLTMFEELSFEHKQFNSALAAFILENNDLPDTHWPQCEQQLIVMEDKDGDKVLFTVSDGTEENCVRIWYQSRTERRQRVIDGWKQFEKDKAAYVPQEVIPAPTAAPVKDLPAITYRLDGLALTSNFTEFKAAAQAMIEGSKKELVTDQDFVDQDLLNKKFSDAEERLSILSAQVISEIKDVDQFCRNLDEIREIIRRARLDGEKLVEAEKTNRRNAIITGGKEGLSQHIKALNERIGKTYMPAIPADFNAAIKGKRNLESMKNAVDTLLANAKIAADQAASKIEENLKALAEHAGEHAFLFADESQLVNKDKADLILLIQHRISQHKQAEEEKERKRLAAQEAEAAKENQVSEAMPSPAAVTTTPVTTRPIISSSTANVAVAELEQIAPAPSAPAGASAVWTAVRDRVVTKLDTLTVAQLHQVSDFIRDKFQKSAA